MWKPADEMTPFGTNQLAQAYDANWGTGLLGFDALEDVVVGLEVGTRAGPPWFLREALSASRRPWGPSMRAVSCSEGGVCLSFYRVETCDLPTAVVCPFCGLKHVWRSRHHLLSKKTSPGQ